MNAHAEFVKEKVQATINENSADVGSMNNLIDH